MTTRRRTRRHRLLRERQARYKARIRDGVLLCSVQLPPQVLDTLVRLRWLPDGPISGREAGRAIERLLAQL